MHGAKSTRVVFEVEKGIITLRKEKDSKDRKMKKRRLKRQPKMTYDFDRGPSHGHS